MQNISKQNQEEFDSGSSAGFYIKETSNEEFNP